MEPEQRRGNDPDIRRVGLHPDFWYPLARSKDVPQGRTHLAMFGGQPIVLARGESGEVFALDDRCAHRQFPLHKGVVCGDMLKCAYHAWTYRKDGSVAGVPYLPKDACRPDGVRAYAVREAYGYVFVFTGERDKADLVSFPELPAFASPRRRTMHFWRKVDCHYSFMHENLMDMVEVRYRFQQAAGKPDRGADFMMAGRKTTEAARKAGDVMTIRTQYPYQTLNICRGGSSEPAFDLWAAYVPYDEHQRTHVSVGMLMIEKPPFPGLIHIFWPLIRRFAESVFTEDRMAVEAEQRAYDTQRADWNQEINPVIIALRDVLVRNGLPLPRASLPLVVRAQSR
jgi:phenylpropionate dioxygenase-like ring-hydroxylating dioxygenase large terminal subunit